MTAKLVWADYDHNTVALDPQELNEAGVPIDDDGDDMNLIAVEVNEERDFNLNNWVLVYESGDVQPVLDVIYAGVLIFGDGPDEGDDQIVVGVEQI